MALTHHFPVRAEGSCLGNKSDSSAVNCQGNRLWPSLGCTEQHCCGVEQLPGVESCPQKLQVKRQKLLLEDLFAKPKTDSLPLSIPDEMSTAIPHKERKIFWNVWPGKQLYLNTICVHITWPRRDPSVVCTQHPLLTPLIQCGNKLTLLLHEEFALHSIFLPPWFLLEYLCRAESFWIWQVSGRNLTTMLAAFSFLLIEASLEGKACYVISRCIFHISSPQKKNN